VQANLTKVIVNAIEEFSKQHMGKTPTNFVFFRDGVSDAQRDQVLKSEVSQFEDAIKHIYMNRAATLPEITVIIVNKRISQRFFMVEPRSGKILNPPSGCIIDKDLVSATNTSGQFDFYMSTVKIN